MERLRTSRRLCDLLRLLEKPRAAVRYDNTKDAPWTFESLPLGELNWYTKENVATHAERPVYLVKGSAGPEALEALDETIRGRLIRHDAAGYHVRLEPISAETLHTQAEDMKEHVAGLRKAHRVVQQC